MNCLISCAQQQDSSQIDFAKLNHYFDSVNIEIKKQTLDSIFKEMVKKNRFNGILLVGQDTQLLYVNWNGYANYQTKQKLNRNSQYELASVSKQFTAVSILKLYEQGLLNLEDTIDKYITGFPYPQITIDQLLNHSSGLPDYLEFTQLWHKNESFYLDNDSLLKMMQKYRPKALNNPGKIFEYSNTGYAILALIVEKVSGLSFAEFLQKNIFEKLQMNSTFIYGKGMFAQNANTIGHRSNYSVYKRDYMSKIYGDKAIFTTADDLWKWNRALDNGSILSDSLLHLAFMPKHADEPVEANYGYGWRLSLDKDSNQLVYHGGLWNGNNTLFCKRLSDKTCVIILSNVFNRSFKGRNNQILDLISSL